MSRRIVGSGGGKGGGGGGSTASIAPDSIRSQAFARVLDLVSEGEIEGLVDGAKSIYLDGTPLQNADGSYNFNNVTWSSRNGTQSQGYIPGFPSIESSSNVGVEVKYAAPATRTFTNPNLNFVRVTIGVPSLTSQDLSTGSVSGTSVDIQIFLQTNGGGYVMQDLGGAGTISGKTSSRYQRSYLIPVSGTGPWDIRVVRATPDSTSDALQNKTWWDTSTEIIDSKLRYPNSAIVGLSVDASQFSSIPSRAYDMKLLRIRVPSNYNPTTRAYTGSWDGTFQIAWSDNPAWCFYDMLTADRYGLGSLIDTTQVDKWALYSIGKYCDQMVNDGFGGLEPRFTCNLYLQTRADAYKVVCDMASIFRGMAFWSSGAVTAIQDAPGTASCLFTNANVIDGLFTYSGSSAKSRHTVALVTWNDPADNYTQKVEYVEDTAGIARYGIVTTEIAAIGCTSRGQANRVGRWLLYSERLETETVAFKTGLEGLICRPGQVIKVADPARAGVRYGGRLLVTGVSSIGLDAPVTLTAGIAYTLATLKADGTVQESAVVHSGGTLTTLNLATPYSEAPQLGSIWVLSGDVQPQLFRVVSVVENDGAEFEVVALAHNESKYDAVENGLILEPRNISNVSAAPAAPTNLAATDSLYVSAQGASTRLQVTWAPVDFAVSYAVTYRQENGNPQPEIIVSSPSVEISNVQDNAAYTVSVRAINALGIRGPSASVSYTVLGKTVPPANVTNFYVARNGDILNFVWTHVPDLDLAYYEIRNGSLWNGAIQIGATAANSFSFTSQRGGTFLIKAVDTSGNESAAAAEVIVPDVDTINVVVDVDDGAAGFPGVYDGTVKLSGGVTLYDNTTTWSDLTQPWVTYTTSWAAINAGVAGTYDSEIIDIGFVATSVVSIESEVELLASRSPWSDYNETWSYYGPPSWTWQGNVGPISVAYQIATSNDNIALSAWQPFVTGAYNFRYLKLRCVLTTTDTNYLPYLTGLVIHVDVPDRAIHLKNVAVGTGGVTLSFVPAFVGIQTVQATLQSALSGDRYTVSSKSVNGVTINIYDSSGAAKAGTIDVDAFGYGTRG
jgi:predicted phage tail protein